ncbi:peroxisomal coenzyme A diphosphatase NUDT7 [Halichoeres trimaculatus]|uniref:peroxisomal coenzyme A diphosphatase NUDT7 n=1 Tax=Halichoeres trimaculatus TaxID=147232 RepID=UPI003D9DE128
MTIKEKTKDNLRQFDIGNKLPPLPVLPRASVLIPLFVRNGQLYTLLTLRSKELRTSAGEVCFPGGKRDPSDKDDIDTALREAEEEIGLHPDDVEVVCTLFPIINKSGLLVTPVVSFIEESFRPSPNPAEVSAVFTVPLDFFIKKESHRAAHNAPWTAGPVHFFHYKDPESENQFHIWGLTAALAIIVAACALRRDPEFDVGFSTEDPSSFFQQMLYRRLSKL